MPRILTRAVFNGTKLDLAISGKNVDSIMTKLRKRKDVRQAFCFFFYERKSNKLIDMRMN